MIFHRIKAGSNLQRDFTLDDDIPARGIAKDRLIIFGGLSEHLGKNSGELIAMLNRSGIDRKLYDIRISGEDDTVAIANKSPTRLDGNFCFIFFRSCKRERPMIEHLKFE